MKCKVCGCDSGKFAVCFEHRNKKYKDICHIHGKTTFINRQCLKCLELKKVIYKIEDNKDRFGNKIDKNHFLYLQDILIIQTYYVYKIKLSF